MSIYANTVTGSVFPLLGGKMEMPKGQKHFQNKAKANG